MVHLSKEVMSKSLKKRVLKSGKQRVETSCIDYFDAVTVVYNTGFSHIIFSEEAHLLNVERKKFSNNFRTIITSTNFTLWCASWAGENNGPFFFEDANKITITALKISY